MTLETETQSNGVALTTGVALGKEENRQSAQLGNYVLSGLLVLVLACSVLLTPWEPEPAWASNLQNTVVDAVEKPADEAYGAAVEIIFILGGVVIVALFIWIFFASDKMKIVKHIGIVLAVLLLIGGVAPFLDAVKDFSGG